MAGFLSGVASGIVATALAGMVVRVSPRIRAWYSFRALRKLWHPFVTSPTKIVLTGKCEGNTVKASVNELSAERAIRSCLHRNEQTKTIIGDDDLIDMQDRNIITLGSEPTNKVTTELLRSVADRVDFYYTADTNLVVDGKRYPSEYQNGVLVKDYGFICKATNPHSLKKRKFLAISGNHGVGTHGAALALTNHELVSEMIQDVRNRDFYAVIEVHADQRYAREPTNVVVRKWERIGAPSGTPANKPGTTYEDRVRRFLVEQKVKKDFLPHAESRAHLATRIAKGIKSRGNKTLDVDAVYLGAMFHDIGRVKSPGIDHGVLGAALIRERAPQLERELAVEEETLENVAEAIECHILGGIRREWIEEAELNLEKKDYVPESLEAKIVAFCDQILHNLTAQSTVFEEAPRYDPEVYKQVYRLTFDIIDALMLDNNKPACSGASPGKCEQEDTD